MIIVRLAALGVFLSLFGLSSACSSTEEMLLQEKEIPELRALGESTDGLQHRLVMVRSDATDGSPLDVAIHEYGEEQEERVVVAIHGVLTDHRVWRYVIGALEGSPEVWAIDLPGCGKSDKPSPTDPSSPDAYSPTWLAKHVMSALEHQLKGRGPKLRLTIVAHSLGGGVALRMLGDPEIARDYPKVLKRIDGAILLAPLEFGIKRINPAFEVLANVTDVQATAGTIAGVVKKAAEEAVYGSSIDPNQIPREEFVRTYEILIDSERRHAMKYMLRRAIPRNDDESIDRDAVRRLQADYQNINVPCLLLWGELDDTLPPSSGYVLAEHIPTARQRQFIDCKHSFHVEQPALCVDQIQEFLDSDLATWDTEVKQLDRLSVSGGERAVATTAQEESSSRLRSESLKTAPSSVSVLPGQNVSRSGARYLSDSLRMVPGVEVQRISSTESGVAFRGFADSSTAAQGTLGLIDDRQVYNQFLGNVLWDQLAVRFADIQRIELVRGPGSFIYGPNAMHGVVNIKTKAPLDYDDDAVSLITHAGSYSSIVAGATVVNRTNLTGIKISTQWDDIGQFGNERGDTRNKGFADAAFEVQLDGDPDHVFGLSAGFSQQLFDLLLPALEGIPGTTAANKGQDLFTKVDYRKGGRDDLALKAQLSWNGFDADFLPGMFYTPFTLDLDTLNLDGRLTWAGGRHFVTGGAGFRYSSFSTSDSDVSNGSHSVNEFWLFGQDEFKVTDSLFFTFGARVDHHSEAGTHISPRIAGVLEFVQNHYFRASAGRGFRNPSLRELWFDMPIEGVPGLPTITIAGNQALKPESLTSFELGYFGAWGSLVDARPGTVIEVGRLGESHQFEAGVSVFYNFVDDLVGFESDPGNPLRVRPVNQDNEEVYGFELEGRYMLRESFSAFANYSYSVRQGRETGETNRVSPRNTFNGGVAYTGNHFSAMLWANFRDNTELDDFAIDSYLLINGSVSYQFPVASGTTGQAFIRFFNLLDDKHREHPQGDEYGLILTGGLQLDW